MTGSGKTELALAVAKRLDGELICGDNTQMHKGLSVLTNKHDFSKTGVESHLYDRYSLINQVDTQRYSAEARQVISEVQRRGKVPILEGGSLFQHI